MNTTSNYIIVPDEARESMRLFNGVLVDIDGVLLHFLPAANLRVFLPDRQKPLKVLGEAVDRRGFYAVCELDEAEEEARLRRITARTPASPRKSKDQDSEDDSSSSLKAMAS